MSAIASVIGQEEPIRLNLRIVRDADWAIELDWTDEEGGPMPPVGTTMTVDWGQSALGGTYPPDLSSAEGGPGGITMDNAGKVFWTLTRAQTAALDFYVIPYWAFVTFPAAPGRSLWAYGRAKLIKP